MEGLHVVLLITRVQIQRHLVGLQQRAVGMTGISVTTWPCYCCCCQQAGAQPAELLNSVSFQPFDTVGPLGISKLTSQLASLYLCLLGELKFCLCLQEPVGLRVPAGNMKYSYFTVLSAACSG